MFGTDHGAGRSQFGIKFNILSSCDRRIHGNEYDTRILSFVNIKCRKDTSPILKLISTQVNEGLTMLTGNRLIGDIDQTTDQVKTYFMPVNSTHIHIHNNYLCYNNNDKTKRLVLPDQMSSSLIVPMIIPSFCCLCIGDLAAQVTLQGLEGCSPHLCNKCNLNVEMVNMNIYLHTSIS